MFAVEIKNVLKRFSSGDRMNVLFNDLNFTVQEGELVVVQGKNGAGKSTLLNMIAAMTPPNKGTVSVFGQDLLSLTRRPEWRMETIGYITDDCCLIPYLTAKQNLLMGVPSDDPAYERVEKQAVALLLELGLNEQVINENLEGLDVKDQMLATIGRIFMTEPKLILADEPTKALGGCEGIEILERLLSFSRRKGTTVIMVSNENHFIDQADRTFRMDNGRVIPLEPRERAL
ncbi:ABC transporter ATP-binding protein [Bacillus sp. H-16]|uniref:ABC transporter ATP-binding protein n=1 Tax=Alteribacter salitolerans TaxID=2912333 RepID=UPI001965E4B2|nr:ABC transporter ATP-binding protein [Alteribacter salitolerans]MBM7096006.1 ABC transporter ATP-binding protein [Alteribacter salitolerans]